MKFCTLGELQPILAQYGLAHPLYNYKRPFLDNLLGAWDAFPTVAVTMTPPTWSLLGQDIGFPLGVPASPLTVTADWIDYYARKGFNVLTYKTVRSQEKDAYDPPNWVFLEGLDKPIPIGAWPDYVVGDEDTWPSSLTAFSTANSFGIPSRDPSDWQRDVEASLEKLRSGQCLIVSVTGNHDVFFGDDLVADFVHVAELAALTGTRAIELNLSCPNTVDYESNHVKEPIFETTETTLKIVSAVRDKLDHGVALVIKLGYLPKDRLAAIVTPLAESHTINAVSGINTFPVEVRRPDGISTFGENRDKAGVSGVAIRDHGIDFVRSLADIRREQNANFEIIGMGGVMNVLDVEDYLRAGANAVQTATGAFVNSSLPKEIYRRLGGAPSNEIELEARSRVVGFLRTGPRTLKQITDEIADVIEPEWAAAEKTFRILQRLEAEGLITTARANGRVVFDARESKEPATADTR